MVNLPPDFDELVYLPVAYQFADDAHSGRWAELGRFAENPEHPPFTKLVYAAVVGVTGVPRPDFDELKVGKPLPDAAKPAFIATRLVSAVFGAAQVVVLTFVSPLGALLVAGDPYHAKYTSQAMLEAIPGLLVVLAVWLFSRACCVVNRRRQIILLLASAALQGAATACKYPYGLVGLVLAAFLVVRFRRQWRLWLSWTLAGVVVFLVFTPNLWSDPIGGVAGALGFHWAYQFGDHVQQSGMPWYQPLDYLTHAAPAEWHRGIFSPVVNWVLLPLAFIGFFRARKTHPVWAAWAVCGLAFLLMWQTKWAQYLLIVIPALAVCAGQAPRALYDVALRIRELIKGSKPAT